jgi:hypothetical protein
MLMSFLPVLVIPAAFVAAFVSVGMFGIERNIAPATAVGLIAALWCRIDSEDRQRPLSNLHTGLIFLLYPIAVPLYLIPTQGRRGFMAVCVAVFLGVVAYFAAQMGFAARM